MVMALGRSLAIVSTHAPSTAWRQRTRVEKTSASNALHGERDGAQDDRDFERRKALPAQASRNGTSQTVRVWDERLLVPAFVTQVLAQCDENRLAHPQAAAAYGQDFAAQVALLCDRSA